MVEIAKISSLGVLCIFLVIILASSVSAKLMVQDFEVNSIGEDTEGKPGEVMTFDFTVYNEGDDDIEDVDLQMWFEDGSTKLEDNTGEDIKEDFNLHDIDSGDDKDVRYDLTIPFDVDNGDKVKVMIKVKAKNATSDERINYEEEIGDFKIQKESHDIFIDASFAKADVDCGENNQLHLYVRDIGTNNEDEVNITALNKLIGVDVKEKFFMDKDYDDSDNTFEKTYSFTVNDDANPGIYDLTVRANFDGGYGETYKTINLTINGCDYVPPSNNQNNQNSQQTTNDSGSTSQPDQSAQTTQPSQSAQPPAQPINYVPAQSTGSQKSESSGISTTTIILIVFGEIALILVIVVLFLALRKKPRQPEF